MNKYAIVPALIFLTIIAVSMADAAVIRTVPERSVWTADGITEYKLYIYVDNSGLNGEATRGVDWKLTSLNGLQYVDGSSSVPDVNDFFAGWETDNVMLFGPLTLSSRFVLEQNGPVNYQGYAGMYKFKVPVNTPPGTYHFELHPDTSMYKINWGLQPYTPESVSFQVVPRIHATKLIPSRRSF